MTTASTLSRQLRLNVHPADGALLVGDEPLVHAQLVEEVHTREASGEETDEVITPAGGRLASAHVPIKPRLCFYSGREQSLFTSHSNECIIIIIIIVASVQPQLKCFQIC